LESSSRMTGMRTLGLVLLLGLIVGCPRGSGWTLISASETDCFSVTVTPSVGDDDDSAAGDDDDSAAANETVIDLRSAPGLFDLSVLGTATLSPASGPAGTEFLIRVALVDTGAEQGNPTTAVDRATVVVDNGDISLNELELEPSPVDERLWTITLVAGGDPDTTTRQDQLCVGLYTATE
jgi:hypothetical protein